MVSGKNEILLTYSQSSLCMGHLLNNSSRFPNTKECPLHRQLHVSEINKH